MYNVQHSSITCVHTSLLHNSLTLWKFYLHTGKLVLTLINMHYVSMLTILHCLLWLKSLKVKHNSMLVIGAISYSLTLCAL